MTDRHSFQAGRSQGFSSPPGARGKGQSFLWVKLVLYCTQVLIRDMW